MEDVWQGIQDAFADLRANVKQQYGVELTRLAGNRRLRHDARLSAV